MSFKRISKKTLQREKSGRQSCATDETYYCRLVQALQHVSMAALCSSGWQWSCGSGTRFLWALGFRPPGCCGPVPPFLATRSRRRAQQSSHCNVTSLPSEGLSKKNSCSVLINIRLFNTTKVLKSVLRRSFNGNKRFSPSKIVFTVRVLGNLISPIIGH